MALCCARMGPVVPSSPAVDIAWLTHPAAEECTSALAGATGCNAPVVHSNTLLLLLNCVGIQIEKLTVPVTGPCVSGTRESMETTVDSCVPPEICTSDSAVKFMVTTWAVARAVAWTVG